LRNIGMELKRYDFALTHVLFSHRQQICGPGSCVAVSVFISSSSPGLHLNHLPGSPGLVHVQGPAIPFISAQTQIGYTECGTTRCVDAHSQYRALYLHEWSYKDASAPEIIILHKPACWAKYRASSINTVGV